MSLTPGNPESLISTHNRIQLDSNSSFYIPRDFKEVPLKNLGDQLEKFGSELNKQIPPRSKPKIMERLSEEARFKHVEEVEKAITIPEKFRPTQIPDSEKAKINLQATNAAENEKPITIDIGPSPIHERSDGSNLLLEDLWIDHIENYLANVKDTTHKITANFVADPKGESWLYDNEIKLNLNNLPAKEFQHSLDLDDLSKSLEIAWKKINPKIAAFMDDSKLLSWQVAKRKIKQVHAELYFDARQRRMGPNVAQYGSEVMRLEESMEKIMEPFKQLGLSEITPQTILDLSNILSETSSQTGKSIEIPFTGVAIPESTFKAVFRKIALELSYNKTYQDIKSPIRITPTDVAVFSKGFSRVGMATSFPGSPSVGTIPEIETPVLITSREDLKTKLFTPIKKSQYPTSSQVVLERKNKRYNLPLFITDQSFLNLVAG
ncbi:hypothetical protein KBD75_04225 [Candidatus Woesebacteria bacterium]|nr:hypothetical protein [Candidatus Woesebacteria bacterium]